MEGLNVVTYNHEVYPSQKKSRISNSTLDALRFQYEELSFLASSGLNLESFFFPVLAITSHAPTTETLIVYRQVRKLRAATQRLPFFPQNKKEHKNLLTAPPRHRHRVNAAGL